MATSPTPGAILVTFGNSEAGLGITGTGLEIQAGDSTETAVLFELDGVTEGD